MPVGWGQSAKFRVQSAKCSFCPRYSFLCHPGARFLYLVIPWLDTSPLSSWDPGPARHVAWVDAAPRIQVIKLICASKY